VAIWDITEAAGRAAEEGISEGGGQALFSRVDVTDASSVERGFEEVIERFGSLSVLVNNAGILRDAQLVKWKDGAVTGRMEERDFDAVISVNLKGVFLCTRAAAPHLIRGGGGAILNATSVVGLYGNFGQTNYVASKAGVIGMTRTWARELGKFGIRVNAVAPGFIATEMVKAMPEKVIGLMIQRTPLGRMGTPEEVASAYAWLASDEAGFVTGAVLSVDGGVVVGT
jgi:3-oxoacyl-[acyl-carrier protein] reductase